MKEILIEIFISIATIAIPMLTVSLVKMLKEKANQLTQLSKNESEKHLIEAAEKTVEDVVIATNQTVVNTIKKAGNFTPEEQRAVRDEAIKEILGMLTDEAKEFINESYGDINTWVLTKLEAAVNKQKIFNR